MFEMKRKLRQQYAALCHYEDQITQKNRIIREAAETLEQAEKLRQVLEECNEALARENKRLTDNRDVDGDLVQEMYSEYTGMLKKYRDLEQLEDENYRLWVENALLRGALARLDPQGAAEIARCGR